MNNMDGYSFIASIVDSLAWPLVTVFILNLVLKNLPSVTKFIKKIKYGDWEVNFAEKLGEVEEKIEKTPEVSDADKEPTNVYSNELFELVEKGEPTYAIIEGWKILEGKVGQLFEEKIIKTGWGGLSNVDVRHYSVISKLKRLELNKIVSDRVYRIIRSLSRLRNQAVHHSGGTSITKEEAYAYLDNLESVLKYLSRIQ